YLQDSWFSLAAAERLEYDLGEEDAGAARISVPLALRDQIIGQINLAGDSDWTPEDRAWIESVATQAAVALENARLMEESRAQAAIERTVTEITKKIWAASTVEGILRAAVKELGGALDASEAVIELNVQREEDGKE
ncbi:MAG: GAF domain-containing protein, partial [Chloroflexota bacterium]